MRSVVAGILFAALSLPLAMYAQTANVTVKEDYVRHSVTPPRNAQSAGRFAWATRPFLRQRVRGPEQCYTLHTLLAAKKPGSDETEIVGQRTCTPASQFDVKTAVQKAK